MADVSILDQAVHAAPKAYVITGSQEIVLKGVTASFDGTSASGSWIPAVQIVDPSGFVVGTYIIGSTLAVGASADVSWFPGLTPPCPDVGPSPNPLGTLFAWYDFADTTTITLDGSGKITLIVDKTGNGHDASAISAATRPGQTTINALNAGAFVSANSTALVTSGWSPFLSPPMYIFGVFTQTIAAGGAYQPGPFGGSPSPNPAILFEDTTNANLRIQQGTLSVANAFGAPFTQEQVTCIYAGASSELRINAVSAAGNITTNSIDNFSIGTSHFPYLGGFVNGLDGAIGELLLYQGPLTLQALLQVEAYLKAKWNTP